MKLHSTRSAAFFLTFGMMLEKFQKFIAEHQLCDPDQEVMLAVSGGVDSVVMTELFFRSGYSCTVLHCNFRLRGSESDGDEAFVRSLAASYDMPVFVEHFDTADHAEEEGISIQMAARKLRYEWFEQISDDHGFKSIATAHNMNDSIETVLINMSRGTGMKGITGIPSRNEKFIRPLLNLERKEILEFAKTNSLQHREDSSNTSRKYQRNKIRHDVIPVLEEVNPAFVKTMHENINRFMEGYEIFRKAIDDVRPSLFLQKEDHQEIDIAKLKTLSPLSTWLYELFSAYNFTRDQCLAIELILDSDSGKQSISTTHQLYKDRNKLLLFELEEEGFDRYYIDSPGSPASLPFAMDIDLVDIEDAGSYPDSQYIAFLDHHKLTFPLTIRKWQHGDYFYPLGMEQMKKVSDFFIDEKVPVPVKNKTWILASGKNIVWIIGLRIDNRYKITPNTKQVLKLHIFNDH